MWSQKFVGYVEANSAYAGEDETWWDEQRCSEAKKSSVAAFSVQMKLEVIRVSREDMRGHDLPTCQLTCNSAAQGRQIDRLGATIFSSLKLYNGDHFEPSQRILETGGCWRWIGSRGRFVAWWEFPTCSLWHRFAGGQSKASDFAQSETSEANCCSSFWGQNRRGVFTFGPRGRPVSVIGKTHKIFML